MIRTWLIFLFLLALDVSISALVHATLIESDGIIKKVELEINFEVAPTPAGDPGYVTASFAIRPLAANFEIQGIDASFGATSDMFRQVGLAGTTVFNDSNTGFSPPEDVSGLGDTQFDFSTSEINFITGDSEGLLHLSAAFALNTSIVSQKTFAHVVMKENETGTLLLELAVLNTLTNVLQTVTFSNPLNSVDSQVPFTVTAVPEASATLIWSLLAAGAAGRSFFVRRRSEQTGTA